MDPGTGRTGATPSRLRGLVEPVNGFARAFGRTAVGMTLDLASGAARAGEAALDSAGRRRRTPGVLRVQVLLLRDESGRPLCSPQDVQPALRASDEILQHHAGTRVRVVGIRTIGELPPPAALDPRAKASLRPFRSARLRIADPSGTRIADCEAGVAAT